MNGGQILGIIVGGIAGWIVAGMTTSPRIVRFLRPGEMEVEEKMPGCVANLLWLVMVAVGAGIGFVAGSALGG